MSCSHALSSRWTSVNEELEQLLANVPKHGEWKELTNTMQDVVTPSEAFFHTISAKDQIFSEVGKVYVVKWKDVLDNENYHNVVYNQDLDQLAIVAGWTALRDFYPLTGDHLDVSSSMYYFLKDKGWTHLHLEDVAECRLVFNHWRKTLKIGAGWKHFCETLSFTADMKIAFEFINPNVNRVLY
ncbi:hypothetical protein GmHk_03G006954 [Glycine max]|nr:hypothetical protein GmHk_03G006954 [Glycine max]